MIGSPGYMSPEQVLGRPLGAASDVFQLGTVLAYAATGQGPFLAGGAAELVTAGWLSTPVMAQLGRRTVKLLNLDTAPEPAADPVAQPTAQPVALPVTPPTAPPTAAVHAPHATLSLTPPASAPPGRAAKRRRLAILVVSAAVVAAGLATTAVLLTRTAAPTGIPAGFVGAWQGDVHGSAVMSESLNLSIFNSPSGARAGDPSVINGRDYLTVPSTQESGLCQPAYRKQQVTARKLVLVRELADVDQGGPWCAKYFQGGTVEVNLTKNGTLDLRWKAQDGTTLQATLTKQP